MPFSGVRLQPTWMTLILPDRCSAGELLNADASGQGQSRLQKKEAEQGVEMGQLAHLPFERRGVPSVGTSDYLGRMNRCCF